MNVYRPVPGVDPKRRRNMAAIRSKDTAPELVIRSALFRRGFRYRLHLRKLPGKPDLVLKKRNAVVLVHGCFWHRHEGCFTPPRSRAAFWDEKLRANALRDERQIARLRELGWRVAVVWECAVREKPNAVIDRLAVFLRGERPWLEISGSGLR